MATSSKSSVMLLFASMACIVIIGGSSVQATRVRRMIGGINTNPGEFNYVVSIVEANNTRHTCTGAIISSKHIITAAHCVVYNNQPTVRSGSHDLNDGKMDWVGVKKFYYHAFASLSNTPMEKEYNVAIMELDRELNINNVNTSIVSLPDSPPNLAQNYWVAGFGFNKYTNTSMRFLQKGEIRLLDDATCRYKGGTAKSCQNLCGIGQRPLVLGNGDCGAPLVNSDNQLEGIVTHFTSDMEKPDTYVNVYEIRNFIRNSIEN